MTTQNTAPTFAVGDGIVTTKIGSSSYGQSVAVQGDGKILVAGGATEIIALTRYNSNGSLDTTFDTDGIVTTKIGSYSVGRSVVVQADGKILVAGYAIDNDKYQFALTRYNSNGSLDTTFDTDGIVTTIMRIKS
jgi:uncharacterized delta-60 repeat protein